MFVVPSLAVTRLGLTWGWDSRSQLKEHSTALLVFIIAVFKGKALSALIFLLPPKKKLSPKLLCRGLATRAGILISKFVTVTFDPT